MILANAGKHAEREVESHPSDQGAHQSIRRDVEGKERKRKRPRLSSAEEKDLRLRTLVSELVKQRLTLHKTPIDRETYKRYAREVSSDLSIGLC